MKYIIMCGGNYHTKQLKFLSCVKGETIVQRTIRLLRQTGVEDIAISSNYKRLEGFGVPVLHHSNKFDIYNPKTYWYDAFYPTDEPVCYIFGDVVFSEYAINYIVNYKTTRIEFFASAPPFPKNYMKKWAEPFAFKVVDTKYFWECVNKAKRWQDEGRFSRWPVSWELWQVIQKSEINRIKPDYCIINDFTCDCDTQLEAREIEKYM